MITSLRFTSQLHLADWNDIISNELPLATGNKISNVRHIAGKFSVSPAILIAKVLIDDKDNLRYITQGDVDFNRNLNIFADRLSTHDQEFYLDEKESNNSSSLEYALKKLLKSKGYIDDFISKIGSLMEKYKLPIKDTKDNRKREVNNEIKLDLPYPSTECWKMGNVSKFISSFDIGLDFYTIYYFYRNECKSNYTEKACYFIVTYIYKIDFNNSM